MAELKTKQTEASVEEYLDTIEDPRRRADCAAISALMTKVTKFEPRMWGPSIVGFGSYHYRYESGHEGDACLVGFSSRKPEIVVYIAGGFDSRETLLQQLGKHRTGKVCVYIKGMRTSWVLNLVEASGRVRSDTLAAAAAPGGGASSRAARNMIRKPALEIGDRCFGTR